MNPNREDMTVWQFITCQQSHPHVTKPVHIDLATPHGLTDLPPIPSHLAYNFTMDVWDWRLYTNELKKFEESFDLKPGDDMGYTIPYCPAVDNVSETIDTTGIWEPAETILALQVFSTANLRRHFLDFGSQIGWFTHLAFHHGLTVDAYDADPDCVRMLSRQYASTDLVNVHHQRIDDTFTLPQLLPWSIRLAKLDLEGAERHAIHALWPFIISGQVDHILMEVSPCWSDRYADLLDSLVAQGYDLYSLPQKSHPPHQLVDPSIDLARVHRDEIPAFLASVEQDDVWLKREGADW